MPKLRRSEILGKEKKSCVGGSENLRRYFLLGAQGVGATLGTKGDVGGGVDQGVDGHVEEGNQMEGEDLVKEADQGVEGRTRMLGVEGGGAGLVKGLYENAGRENMKSRRKPTNSWR